MRNGGASTAAVFAGSVTIREHDTLATGSRVAGLPAATPGDRHDDGAWAIMLFAGACALALLTCLDAALVDPVGPRLALLVGAVAVLAERAGDPRTAFGGAVVAFACGDGFLQHHAGELTWNTAVDYPFTLGLLGAVALGLSAAQIRAVTFRDDRHALRNHQDRAPAGTRDPSVRL